MATVEELGQRVHEDTVRVMKQNLAYLGLYDPASTNNKDFLDAVEKFRSEVGFKDFTYASDNGLDCFRPLADVTVLKAAEQNPGDAALQAAAGALEMNWKKDASLDLSRFNAPGANQAPDAATLLSDISGRQKLVGELEKEASKTPAQRAEDARKAQAGKEAQESFRAQEAKLREAREAAEKKSNAEWEANRVKHDKENKELYDPLKGRNEQEKDQIQKNLTALGYGEPPRPDALGQFMSNAGINGKLPVPDVLKVSELAIKLGETQDHIEDRRKDVVDHKGVNQAMLELNGKPGHDGLVAHYKALREEFKAATGVPADSVDFVLSTVRPLKGNFIPFDPDLTPQEASARLDRALEQNRLSNLGYFKEPIDGKPSAEFTDAVRNFATAVNEQDPKKKLRTDGQMDKNLSDMLIAADNNRYGHENYNSERFNTPSPDFKGEFRGLRVDSKGNSISEAEYLKAYADAAKGVAGNTVDLARLDRKPYVPYETKGNVSASVQPEAQKPHVDLSAVDGAVRNGRIITAATANAPANTEMAKEIRRFAEVMKIDDVKSGEPLTRDAIIKIQAALHMKPKDQDGKIGGGTLQKMEDALKEGHLPSPSATPGQQQVASAGRPKD